MEKLPIELQKAVTLLEAVFHGFRATIGKDRYAWHEDRFCTMMILGPKKEEKPIITHNGMRLHEFIELAGNMSDRQHKLLQKGIILSKGLRGELS